MKNLKVVFMGTPDFAVPVLKTLIENTNVVLVVSQPDAYVGRKKVLTPSPVKQLALENNIEVFTPYKIREDYEKIIETNPDIIITCAYGQIIPKILLDLPKYKCINVHASLLPKYRGGAPIHAAILNGDDKTGITIMYMAEGMDDGDIIKKESINILDNDNINTLSEKLSTLGSKLLIEALPNIISGNITRIKQNESEVTFAYTIKREDEKIDFNKTYKEIYNKVRALLPRSYFILNGIEYKVISIRYENKNGKISTVNSIYKDGIGISCKDGEVVITEFIPAGKKQMQANSYLNGIDKKSILGVKINEE
ncbi:MAG: methionyl-tRNA formyltransferase [Bacilli bacterium]|nr:methionyl-tRNA formyltransferase [Bacilli bacterium]